MLSLHNHNNLDKRTHTFTKSACSTLAAYEANLIEFDLGAIIHNIHQSATATPPLYTDNALGKLKYVA